MKYVMSDIHGCYHEYMKMLELINFTDNDTLYIVGDVCDRRPNSMEILLHMSEHENIVPIFGNHDVDAYRFLLEEYNGKEHNPREFLSWICDGGRVTLKAFEKLDKKKQEKILSYLEEFRYYEEIKVNNIEYILVHGGLRDFDINKPLSEYNPYDLVWERPDYDRVYFPNKYIISGHTPTHHIDMNMRGKIIFKNNHILIDCGCVFGNNLACLCLDTMEEFYIKKED